jgi:NAD(P)-dependent dehydrogenase (short-subunit alcohol dehydrogenase family)
MSLVRKNALITGGASGIGRSVGLRLARDRINVAILDIDLAGAREVAEQVQALGCDATAVQADVARRTDVNAAVVEVRKQLGIIQILINSAGTAQFVPFDRMAEDQWEAMMNIHVKGAFNCTQAVMGDMVESRWGRIVNVASVAGLRGARGLVHYSAAKAGLIGFTKALARELGPMGITVNAVAPGMVDTPMLRRQGIPSVVKGTVRQTPVGRVGKPEDVAGACAYLVSEEAGFCTGHVLNLNGGFYI